VRIPKEALLGTPNAGVSHLTAVLNFERSGVNRVARYMAHLEDFLTEAKPAGLWADSSVRESVGALTAQIEACRDVCWRVVALQRKGDVPTWEAFMAELYRKEINPKFGRLIFELFGREATIEDRGEPVLLGGRPEWLLREGFNNRGQSARFDTLKHHRPARARADRPPARRDDCHGPR
jgi:alkylation response protein AidB-like acyl-CoA dehydrogenase